MRHLAILRRAHHRASRCPLGKTAVEVDHEVLKLQTDVGPFVGLQQMDELDF